MRSTPPQSSPQWGNRTVPEGSEVRFTVPRAMPVRLTIHDASGRRVRVLENGLRQPGNGITTWDGRDGHGIQLERGVYYVRGQLGGQKFTSRIVLLRQ